MNYDVTIGIPVYNVEKYVRESLESALAQTFPNIEFLICDDCGTDHSIDIVRDLQQSHPRGKDIRIVRQPQNMGLGCGRNRMIAEAQGRYIFFMDADDLLSANAIELLYRKAVEYDADIVYGSMEKVLLYDNCKRERNADYPNKVFLKENEFAEWVYRQYDRLQASTCNFLIKTAVYRDNHIQYKPVNYWEDFTTTLDLPTYVTKAVLLSDVTYYYICREGTMSNYQTRTHIDQAEIVQTMQAIQLLKDDSLRIAGKPYISQRMLKLMMTCFYVVCTVLRNGDKIQPAFSRRTLRDFMRYPLPFSQICMFRMNWFQHIVLYSIGVLPPVFAILLVRLVGKYKKLI